MGGALLGATITSDAIQISLDEATASLYGVDPIEFGQPYFYKNEEGIYRYKDGESVLVSTNTERWSPWIKDYCYFS